MNEFSDNLKLATNVTSVTLVGFFGDFPMKRGNCFSVNTEDDKEYRIVNFNHENLEELLKRKVLEFPIKISTISESRAIICDERIPDEWYSNRFCESCTPKELLPLPQRLQHFLDIKRGIRTETVFEVNGQKMIMTSIKLNKK